MSRSLKFHHRDRIKHNRRFHWGRDLRGDEKALSKAVSTPHPCSCLFCGNRRKHSGQTRQELKSSLRANEVESAPVPFRAMEAEVAKVFGVNKRNVRIDWNHPVGEDVIYINGEFKGYLDRDEFLERRETE